MDSPSTIRPRRIRPDFQCRERSDQELLLSDTLRLSVSWTSQKNHASVDNIGEH